MTDTQVAARLRVVTHFVVGEFAGIGRGADK